MVAETKTTRYLQGFQDVEAGLETGVFGFISYFSTRLQFRKDISDNHEGYLFYGRFLLRPLKSES